MGGSDAVDSDVDPATSLTDAFIISAGVIDDTRDAGLVSANTTTTMTGTSTVIVGDRITYTITVFNSGPTGAQRVVSFVLPDRDMMPEQSSVFIRVSSSDYDPSVDLVVGSSWIRVEDDSRWAFTSMIPVLRPNVTVTYTIVVTALTPGVKTSTASTTSDTPDPNGNDNSSSTTTIVDQQFTLTIAKTGTGVGTVTSAPAGIDCGSTCTYTFTAGTVVTLTATPDVNSTFTGWSGAASGTGTAAITMDADKSVTATFEKKSRSIIESIVQDLISFRGTVSNKDDGKKLDEAIKNLTKALDLSYWFDGDHLQSQKGEKVFSETKDAVNKLRNLMKEKKSTLSDEVLQEFIDSIVQVDRNLVTIAINDAINLQGNPNDISKANEELSKGDADIANAKYESGIEHYRNAWNKAIKSMPQALIITGADGSEEQIVEEFIPSEFGLMQNYPNPFNPSTTISYNIANESKVILKVFDILGREIRTLVDSELSPGNYRAEFNGSGLASGIYLYQIRAFPSEGAGNIFVDTKKFILMK
jgi:tetratricopeptide (TPR) repeat protein